jgi:hypothetical protein
MTYEVGDTRRPTLTINPYDGNTIVVLTLTSSLGVVTTPALTGPAAGPLPGDGVWTAPQYTLTAAQRWTERWVATNAVTGLGAGAQSVEIDVEPTPPAAGPGQSTGLATVAQYAAIIGGPLPANLARRLRVASSTIRNEVSGAVFDTTDAATLATLAEATCEQVAWGVANGWASGTPTTGRQVSIGTVSLGASSGSTAGGGGAIPTLAPIARELLMNAGLLGGEPTQFWGFGYV